MKNEDEIRESIKRLREKLDGGAVDAVDYIRWNSKIIALEWVIGHRTGVLES